MDSLPIELIEKIYSYLSFDELGKIVEIDQIASDVLKRNIANISFLQRFIRKKRILWKDYENEQNLEKRKKMLVRIYITTYPEEFLYEYPLFLADKMRRPDLIEWIQNNPIKTRRDVQKFLLLDNVSEYDIRYAGW